jgi:uncharacterized membrane protein YphA (DoxX/SURF4 family)
MAPFVGYCEIIGGALILLGLFPRVAARPLIIDMLVAISTTKIPWLLNSGFWAMAHEARVAYARLLGLLFLFLTGAGTWSVDAQLAAWAARRHA